MTPTIHSIATEYFRYLGSRFPFQSASDEFYFFPRSETAVQHLDALDRLQPDVVEELLMRVGGFVSSLSTAQACDLEEEIDRITVKQSMERVISEFSVSETWKTDPTLYVKIPLFACDEIMSREEASHDRLRRSLSGILAQIPCFLDQAMKNLRKPPENSVRVALSMTEDALGFFRSDVPLFVEQRLNGDPELLGRNRVVLGSWESYADGLKALRTELPFGIGETRFAMVLSTCLNYPGTPGEVLELAEQSFHRTLARAEELAEQIDPGTRWQILVQDLPEAATSPRAILDLYRTEVGKLREFFRSNHVMTFPQGESVQVRPTPSYLASLRASASYKAPLTGNPSRNGVFHITPTRGASRLVHSHAVYLSAHETYPGHHLLDAVRLRNPNPVRRQIESPLFYEGWACYAETLLDDLEYLTEPRHRLVQVQRRLWRNLRAILDVKLQTNKITFDAASEEIKRLGFSAETAHRQLQRFALTPGYQSCYFLGLHEILRLRQQFGHRLGLRRFHDTMLQGGQIAFDLVEKRLRVQAQEAEHSALNTLGRQSG